MLNNFGGISFGNPEIDQVVNYRALYKCRNTGPDGKSICMLRDDLDNFVLQIYKVDITKKNDVADVLPIERNILNGQFVIKGTLKDNISKLLMIDELGNDIEVKYIAPNKPNRGYSFTGSGQPFPNIDISFSNCKNYGSVKVSNDGTFEFVVDYPNSYYHNNVLVPPSVLIAIYMKGKCVSKLQQVVLDNIIPYRTTELPPQRNWLDGPLFYCNRNLKPRTQEQILKENGYPTTNKYYPNFWGTLPPH